MIYVFHGDDPFSADETVGSLRTRLAAEDPAFELNTSLLDGTRLTVGALEEAASAAPFLGDKRLVVVRGLVTRCNPKGTEAGRKELGEALVTYLPRVPATTRLVLVDGDVHRNNPVLRWAEERQRTTGEDAVVVKEFEAPKAGALPAWIGRRVSAQGVAIEASAAVALAEALSREGRVDLRLADSEILKLLTYAGDRPVTDGDVTTLVTSVSLESIFKLMDALADRNGPVAATLLHQFLAAGEPPLRIMALIVRQIRLLTLARGLLDGGANQAAMAAQLPVPSFVAPKLARQARRFTMTVLVQAVSQLATIDADIKTGRAQPVVALDLFVADLCGVGLERA